MHSSNISRVGCTMESIMAIFNPVYSYKAVGGLIEMLKFTE